MALPRSAGPDPLIFAVAAFQVLFGLVIASILASQLWLMDATRNLRAATDLLGGRFGTDPVYLYSPLAAALTVPATVVPAVLAGAAWLALRIGVVAAGVRRVTLGRPPLERVLILAGVLGFMPVVVDLMLGNVSILLAASVAVVAWSPDRGRSGVLLGLALATVPKPALIPILIWMVVYRRRSFVAAVATAGILTAVAVIVLGFGPYQAWFDALRHPLYLGGTGAGNLSLAGLLPDVLSIPLQVVSVVAALVALKRGETPGFVGAIAVGLLVAPYTMAYGAVFLLLAALPLRGIVRPLPAAIVAIAAPVLVVLFLPVLAGATLAAATVRRRADWPRLALEDRS